MSSVIPNTFANVNISFVFLWKMLPAGDTSNGNLLYLYLPN